MTRLIWFSAFSSLMIGVSPIRGDEPQEAKVVSRPESKLAYELLRTTQKPYRRTTIWLYVKPEADVSVTARCHLCKGGEDLGRFPLSRLDNEPGRVKNVKDDGRLLFMVECLAEPFTAESYISLRVTEGKTGKILPGLSIPIKQAAFWNGP